MNIQNKKHSFPAAFSVGLIALLILAALCVLAFSGLKTLFTSDDGEMLTPDGIIYDGESITPEYYIEPPLKELKSGMVLMEGLLALTAKHDLPDFNDGNEIQDEMLISLGVWLALTDSALAETFEINDEGEMKIPADTVKRIAANRFNRNTSLSDNSVDIYGSFEFLADEQVYIVPIYGMDAKYIPRVKSVSGNESEGYKITLGYHDAVEFIEGFPSDISSLEVKKTVEITVSKDQPYKLLSLKTYQ